MFSNRVNSGKGRGIWKVRPMPPASRRCAGSVVMSRPIRWIVPELTETDPASRSNIVVLPAPFGPIRPRISPRATASDMPSTAATPPKRLVRLRASRTISAVMLPLMFDL
ncbi:MAG: hypothetical protein ACD_54C00895G0001 [uncultured bacterium]|nr:MAG: hypothetical protein ACD_54C00895G0001 [uncultured bacterium]